MNNSSAIDEDIVDIEMAGEPENDPARDMEREEANNTVDGLWGHFLCMIPLIVLCFVAYAQPEDHPEKEDTSACH